MTPTVLEVPEPPVPAEQQPLLSRHDPTHDNSDANKEDGRPTKNWSRGYLIAIYASIFLIYFINSLQQQISSNLLAYVTSAFGQHALLSTTGIVATIVSGVIKLPTARLMDVIGRAHGFILMLFCVTIALFMMTICNNVETYAAAQVFYRVGMDGMVYVLSVFIADTSSLRNRGIMFAFTSSPYIVTSFLGPSAAQYFLTKFGWRWVFASFALLTPLTCAPFLAINFFNSRKQQNRHRPSPRRTFRQSIQHYFIEFDVIGLLLICAGFSILLLLPVSYSTSPSSWTPSGIVRMVFFGIFLLTFFFVYESYVAPKPFLPFTLLTDRTVIGASLLAATVFIAFYTWDVYFTSYLQVVHNLSVSSAGYISNIFSIGSCFSALVTGIMVRASNRVKWIACIFLPIQLLGTALMIHYRQPHTPIVYVIMCQILIAASGGALVICEEIATMASCGKPTASSSDPNTGKKNNNIATSLALLSLFASLGGAVGSAISGAIWTSSLPRKLLLYLPTELKPQAKRIYGDINLQLGFEWGSPAREAIVRAYGDTQRMMTGVATAVLVLGLAWVAIWRDVKLDEGEDGAREMDASHVQA